MKSEEELNTIYSHLRTGALAEEPIDLGIEEFKRLYKMMLTHSNRQVPSVVLVNLGDQVQLLFPEWSRQEIIIQGRFNRDDFQFLSLVDWRGADGPGPRFLRFLGQEVWHSRWRNLAILLISALTLLLAGPPDVTYNLLNTLLIQASTVFLIELYQST